MSHGRRTSCLLAAMALMMMAGGAAAETYRWRDADGTVHFSDQPPPPSVDQVETRNYASPPPDANQPYLVRKAAADFPVTLYTSADCGKACDDAKQLLQKRGIPYREVTLKSADDVTRYKAVFDAAPMLPSLQVGRHPIRGLEATSWNALLTEAGYPTERLPGAPPIQPNNP